MKQCQRPLPPLNRLVFAWVSLLALGALLGGCATQSAHQASTDRRYFDPTPRLAVISAFEPELTQLRAATQIKEARVLNGRSYYVGRLAGKEVVLLMSGISMVNAAMTTQDLLDHFSVREIIFSGIAGGVNPNLKVGDVTVPAEWGEYQEQVFARETAGGWDPGRFGSEFSNYGMMFPKRVAVTRRDGEPDQPEPRFWFPADPEGLKIARRIASQVKLSRGTDDGQSLSAEPRVIVGGKGVSGPTFVDNAAYRQWVWQTFQADALDMETAAVAQVAYVNQVPYIGFRSLSDLAGGGSGQNEMDVFFKLAADNSAAVVQAYVQAFEEHPANPTVKRP